MTLVFIAGPYRDPNPAQVTENVLDAVQAAQELLSRGVGVICPHSMTHGWEKNPDLHDGMFLENALEQVARCDAVLVVGDWKSSEGTVAEIAAAERGDIDVYFDMDLLMADLEAALPWSPRARLSRKGGYHGNS